MQQLDYGPGRAKTTRKNMKTLYIDCTNGVSGDMVLRALAELAGLDTDALAPLEFHTHDHEHRHGHDHDHDHDHDHGHEVNAHIWLDAENAIAMVENLAEGLIVQLPQHAQAISANRDAYVARLRALDAELTEGLTGLARHDIITFHEAFPYFAEAYGLHVAAVLNHEPDDALSPRALAELCEEVAHHGTPPLFVEPQYEDIAAQIVARETGAEIHVLDPVVTGPEGEITLRYYEDVMRANMAVLQAVLGQ